MVEHRPVWGAAAATAIPYSDEIEQIQPDEADYIRRCLDSLLRTNEMTFDLYRHGYRATHAKSHGILRGRLDVHEDLADELAQGLFARPASYPVVARIATETGQLDDDRKPNARGLALKVLDVAGPKLHPEEPNTPVHDMLFNTLPWLPGGTAKTFTELTEIRERYFAQPQNLAAALAERSDGEELAAFDRLANIHPLAHAYYTQAAFRYGDYVAKIAALPAAARQRELAQRTITDSDHRGILRELLASHTAEHETVFAIGAQLRTNAERMPVEDAGVDWPQNESPYRTVATVRLPRQDPYSPPRRVFADDRLAFRPMHGLAAHRPLGSINRLRRHVYDALGSQRFGLNAVSGTEMTDIDELPD